MQALGGLTRSQKASQAFANMRNTANAGLSGSAPDPGMHLHPSRLFHLIAPDSLAYTEIQL